jgi:hypothetical protein
MELQLPVQSVPLTTKVMSSNPANGGVYSIQHYVIKFASDLRQVSIFLRVNGRFIWFKTITLNLKTILYVNILNGFVFNKMQWVINSTKKILKYDFS